MQTLQKGPVQNSLQSSDPPAYKYLTKKTSGGKGGGRELKIERKKKAGTEHSLQCNDLAYKHWREKAGE